MQAAVAADAGPIVRSKTLDDSLARAHQLAVAQSHASVTLEHLLFSLQDDPDSQAILDMSGVGRDKLAADVSAYVGRLSEMMPAAPGVAPQPGPDLLRILQLAAMAARQSQRRAIDGAIVLAAIIGDGNSPAAGMLKAQGLTFEAVIKVLSQIGQPRQQEIAPEAPRATLPPPSTPPAAATDAQVGAQAGPSPAAQAREAARAARAAEAPSADDMLASVRARVKKSEPATVPIKTVPPKAEPSKAAPQPTTPDVTAAATRPAETLPAEAKGFQAPMTRAGEPEIASSAGAGIAAPRAPSSMPRTPPAADVPDRQGPALAEMRRPQTASPMNPPGLPPPIPSSQAASRPPLPHPVPGPQGMASQAMPPQVATPQGMAPPPPRQHAVAPPTPMSPLPPAPPQTGPYPSPQTMAPPVPRPFVPPPPVGPSGGPSFAPPQPAPAPPQFQPPLLLNPAENLNIVAAAAGLPASMRMGTPVLVEVRIPRDQIDVPRRRGPQGLGAADTPIYRVVSVRLGTGGVSGLAIEPRSPETVWLGMGRDLDQHDFVWQFVVTPTRAGRFAVTLGVSGRTVSPFGVAGDGTPQTETFAVVVKRLPGGRTKRALTLLTVFALGATTMALAGGPLISAAKTLAARLLK